MYANWKSLNFALILCCFGFGQTLCCFMNTLSARCSNYRCTTEENISWATDGKSCNVFRNACFLASQNCRRRNSFLRALNTVDKDDCQLMCKNVCTTIYQPLCATYDSVYRTFANKCEMQNYICNEGKPYMLVHTGACEESLNARMN